MIYAVDFDGTLCSDKWPDIGEPNTVLIEDLKRCRKEGTSLILWTCRVNEKLEEAIEWCPDAGIGI